MWNKGNFFHRFIKQQHWINWLEINQIYYCTRTSADKSLDCWLLIFKPQDTVLQRTARTFFVHYFKCSFIKRRSVVSNIRKGRSMDYMTLERDLPIYRIFEENCPRVEAEMIRTMVGETLNNLLWNVLIELGVSYWENMFYLYLAIKKKVYRSLKLRLSYLL